MTVVEWIAENKPEKAGFLTWELAEVDVHDAWTYMPTPDALLRGGGCFFDGTDAGPLSVDGGFEPFLSGSGIGFRCAPSEQSRFNTFNGFCDVVRRLAVWKVIA